MSKMAIQKKCPKCGSKDVIPVKHGLYKNMEELLKLEKEGKVFLGGCDWPEPKPKFLCKKCRNLF